MLVCCLSLGSYDSNIWLGRASIYFSSGLLNRLDKDFISTSLNLHTSIRFSQRVTEQPGLRGYRVNGSRIYDYGLLVS